MNLVCGRLTPQRIETVFKGSNVGGSCSSDATLIGRGSIRNTARINGRAVRGEGERPGSAAVVAKRKEPWVGIVETGAAGKIRASIRANIMAPVDQVR